MIAAIHGGCIGAGVDLASACDLRVASADAFFQVAEVDVAITADLGTLQRLGYLIPQGVLRELTYTGRRMAAEEAARYGLVNRIEADREAAIAAGLELARDHRRQVAARRRRRQAQPQPQPRPAGRGGAARRRLVERRHPGQRRSRPKRCRPGSARPSPGSGRSTTERRRRSSGARALARANLQMRLSARRDSLRPAVRRHDRAARQSPARPARISRTRPSPT